MDPATQLHSRLQRWHAAPLRAALERAAFKRGDPPRKQPQRDRCRIAGPLYYRRWFSREPINGSFVDLIVRGVLARLRRDHPEPGEQGVRAWRP